MSKTRRNSLNQRIRDTMQRMHTQVWEARDLIVAYGPHPYTGKTFNSIVHTLLCAELARGNLVRDYDPVAEVYGFRLTNPPVRRPSDFFDVERERQLRPWRRRITSCIEKAIRYFQQPGSMDWAVQRVKQRLDADEDVARAILEVELPRLNRQHAKRVGLEYPADGSWEYPTPESLAEIARRYPEDKVNFF